MKRPWIADPGAISHLLYGKDQTIPKQRVNEQITLSPVRVVNQAGEMLGEMPTDKARQLAADVGLDLVEVAPDDRPPVCRIMDFGKTRYDRKKKQSDSHKARRTQLKQIRLRAKTGEHDIEFKVRQAEKFLQRKDKVKINVLFRGRENAHHGRGQEILADIVEKLKDVASVEQPPSMESRRTMSMILTPKTKSK